MEGVANLLRELHWHQLPDCIGECVKPVFGCRDWKAMIGPNWTTIWRHDGQFIQEMDSVKTEDLDDLRSRLEAVMSPLAKPARKKSA